MNDSNAMRLQGKSVLRTVIIVNIKFYILILLRKLHFHNTQLHEKKLFNTMIFF